MTLAKKLFICAIGACSLLAGCGSKSSSSDKSPSAPSADIPSTPTFSVSSCEEISDAAIATQMEEAKAKIADILEYLGEGNFSNAQAISAQTKATFKAVLDKYPANCEAQLGYALSIVTDIINNAEIKAFIDTVANKKDLVDMDIHDFNKILVTGDGKLMTSVAQSAMAQAIPSMDSAIIYMRNIVSNKDFTCKYTYDERTYELDRGEFAPALAALFVAKATLTFGASLNIDFSNNGKYDWLNELDTIEEFGSSTLTMQQVEKLLDTKSSFTTVYESWKPSYKSIPNLLDSAISYVELGLQYGIEESQSGLATQQNDPYVVGEGEMADVSVADFQKAIDSLEYYRQALRTGVEVTLPHGSKVTINIAKFFEITDGFQEYLPYHHINKESEWYTPVDGFYWSAGFDDAYNIYAVRDIALAIKKDFEKNPQLTNLDPYILENYFWDENYGIKVEWQACIRYKFNGQRDRKCYSMAFNNCTVSFEEYVNPYDTETNQTVSVAPAPATIGSAYCKVENGQTLFARAYRNAVKNMFYFTDAKGNKTLSIQALENGYIEGDELKEYNARNLGNYIFFPDITFGGVLPGMTAEKFWNIIATEDDDEEEDEDFFYADPVAPINMDDLR